METAARGAIRTLYIVTAFYVGIGFLVAVPASLNGDRLSTFLGFLIISGAIAGAALISTVLRLSQRMTAIDESITNLSGQIDRLGRRLSESQDTPTLDLADFGRGDPSVLTAAKLPESMFPRLVTAMEEKPPAQSASDSEDAFSASTIPLYTDSAGAPSRRNLLRTWTVARREGDVATCRQVFSALVQTARADLVERMRVELEDLSHHVDRSLRAKFAAKVREGDYVEALEIGDQIQHQFPDGGIAADYERIQPHLLERIKERQEERRLVANPL